MLALYPVIAQQLRATPQLAGWDVRSSAEPADRRPLPAADLRCIGASVADSATGAAMVMPQWLLTLVVRRGPAAEQQLDAAFCTVFGVLHNWAPGEAGGRRWERLRLLSVTEPQYTPEGCIGLELTFTTSARYLSDHT